MSMEREGKIKVLTKILTIYCSCDYENIRSQHAGISPFTVKVR